MAEANEIINIIWTFLDPFRDLYTTLPSKHPTFLTQLFIEVISLTFICIVGFTVVRVIYSSIWIGRAKRTLAGFRNAGTGKEQFLQAVPVRYSQFAASLSEYDGKLYLDQDCDTVLSELWYPSILKSYLLPAGAALLTGIGVLGTFLGLLIGIQELDLEDLGAIHRGIINIAGGASTAFETSVWGVALSLALTLIEKLASAYVKEKYLNYQKMVAANFPPLPMGSIFLDIKKEIGESRNVLNGLAEQISNNMQTSLDSFIQKLLDNLSVNIATASASISSAISDGLVDTINTTLAPAINNIGHVAQDLADRQAKGSEEVLGSLLQSFSGKLTEEGDNQRVAMQAASQEMQQSLTAFTENMTTVINSILGKSQEMSLAQSSQLQELQAAFERQHEKNGQSLDKARQDMLELVGTFSQGVQKELGAQASQLGQIAQEIERAMQSMGERMNDFMAALATQQTAEASAQKARAKDFEDGARKAFNEYSALFTENMTTVINSILGKSQEMSLAQSSQLQELQAAFERQHEKNGQSLDKARQDMLELVGTFSQGVQKELGAQASQLGQIAQEIERAMQSMGERMNDFMAALATQQTAEASVRKARAKAFEDGARKAFNEYSTLLQISGQHLNGQMEGMRAFLDQASQLQANVREEHKKLQELAYAMSASSRSLEKASGCLDAFAGNIQASIEKNAQSVGESVALLNGIEKRQSVATASLQNLLGQAKTVQDGLARSSANLTSSMGQVMDNFNNLTLSYNTLRQDMSHSLTEIREAARAQTNELADHMTKLLTEFGNHLHTGINDRMHEWNEQTRTFCDNMTTVVQGMSDLVDALDDGQKNGSSRIGR